MEEDYLQQTTNIPNTSLAQNLPSPPSTDFIVNGARNKARIENIQDTNFRNSLTNQSTSLFSTPLIQDTRINANSYDVPFEEVYSQLNDGSYISKFENYIGGTNNEDRLAQQQGFGEKVLNGVGKFVGKTAINILDATAGTVNGLIEGVSKGNLNAVYDNKFTDFVDDVNTKLDYKLPNYYSEQEKNASLFSNVASTNFWADKVLGGASFVVGTLVSEALWATATGGASIATMGARGALKGLGKEVVEEGVEIAAKNQNKIMHSITSMMDGYQRTVPVNKVLKALNNARFLYTSAGYESGVEARHFMKEAERNYLQSFSSTHGRRPTGQELSEFKTNAENGANGVFFANLALVGGSNIAQFGSIFGVGSFLSTKGLERGANRALGIGVERTLEGAVDTYAALKPSRIQRILGTSINVLKSPIREGVIEEGGQNVFGNFGQRWLASKYDPNAVKDNFSAIEEMGKAIAQTYTSKQGLEEVLIGSIIGLGSSVKEGFHIRDYQKAVDEQSEFANYRTANSDYNLLAKFNASAAQKSAKEKASQNMAAGETVLTHQELNMALFSKLQVDDKMGLLDNSSANFAKSLNELDSGELAQQLGVSLEDAERTKTEAIEAHTVATQDYKQAQSISEALIPAGINTVVGDTKIPSVDMQDMMTLNIYMGKSSDRLTKAYAKAVADTIGDAGLDSALQLETTLQSKVVNKSKEVRQLSKELSNLDSALNRRNLELIRIAAKPRTAEGDTQLEAFENRRQELLAQEERDQKRREEINTELESITADINKAQKARRVANQDFDTSLSEGNITVDGLLEATTSLQTLSDTLSAWRTNGQEKAATDVEFLVDQFDKAQKSYTYANEVFNKISDPRLRTEAAKDIFGKFLTKAKKSGVEISDYQKAERELYNKLAQQYSEFRNINDIFTQEITSPVSTPTETLETGDDLPVTRSKTSGQSNVEEEIRKDFEGRRAALRANIPETSEELENENTEAEINSINAQIQELDVEEQAALNEAAQRFAPVAPVTTQGILQGLVDRVLKGRRNVDVISTPMKRPSEEQLGEYKKLYERNRKSSNGLKPADRIRFDELRDMLNAYGRAIGTVEGGIRLSDLLEQIAVLQQTQVNSEGAQVLNDTNTELIRARLSVSGAGSDNFNKTQYYEKSEFRVLDNGNYSITGINVQGLLDIVGATNSAVVLYDKKDGQKNNRKQAEKLKGEDYKPGDKFILKFATGEEVGITIGRTRNLEINPAGIEILNSTRLKLIPSTFLGTNYQPLLQEINTGADITPLEVVNTNFDLEPGLTFTDFTNKADDTELSVRVSLRNEYNQNLIKDYKSGKIKLQELQNSLSIYIMSDEGEVGGLLKAIPQNVFSEDSNFENLSQIRSVAAQRALNSNLENEIVDTRIIIPFDKNGSYLGKPNFNLELNKETNTLSAQLIPLSDSALKKISDVGFIENGRLTLKNNEKSPDKINTIFVKNLSAGNKIPVIIFNYNGSRVAYPVTINKTAENKAVEYDNIINTDQPINEKINSLNEFLAANNLNPNDPAIGFYYAGGETNLEDNEHVDRVREQLQSQDTYADFNDWLTAPSLDAAKSLMQQQSSINIDITDKPFHSPKMGLKLANKIIIGNIETPSAQIIETQANPEIIEEKTCG